MRDAECREEADRGSGIALAFEQQRADAAGDQHLGVREAARQHGRLDEAIAAAVQFIAAAHQIDGAFEAAAEHDDAVDLFRQRGRTLEAFLAAG